jgi:hypothetical protein
MASLDRLTAMSDAHAKQRDSIIAQLVKLLLGLWSGVDQPDNHFAVIGTAAKSAMLTQTAANRARLAERSYVTAQLRELGVSTTGLPAAFDGSVRLNADPLDVWQRPVGQWIWQRRQGETLDRQREAMQGRVADIAGADVLTAARDEASNVYGSRQEVLGYRRVIHPELSRSGTCGLCIVAAQRVYHSSDLLPLHGATCNCDTLAITKSYDPGLHLNDADLKQLYAEAGSTAAAALQNTRYTVHEHGELGPVLYKEGDHFRTAKEAGRPDYVRPTPENIAAAFQRNLTNGRSELAAAQSNYDAFVRGNPGSDRVDGPKDAVAERLILFRSLSNLSDYVRALEASARAKGVA